MARSFRANSSRDPHIWPKGREKTHLQDEIAENLELYFTGEIGRPECINLHTTLPKGEAEEES